MGLRGLTQEAGKARILVIGDMALDYYRIMSPQRLSPEAPVVVFSQDYTEIRPGCAANVANNLHAIGCEVAMLSCVGYDWSKYENAIRFPFAVNLIDCKRPTTIKERIITKKQQIARIDTKVHGRISTEEARNVTERALEMVDDYDVVLFSDYDHGALTPRITGPIIYKCLSNDKHVVVDSKALDSCYKYGGASIMLPNEEELRVMTGLMDDPVEDVAEHMLVSTDLKAIGVTLGAKGILLLDGDKKEVFPPYGGDEVVDITGAGDTAAAAAALALALGRSMEDAVRLANIMGGIVVMKRGVATASPREVEDAIEETGEQDV